MQKVAIDVLNASWPWTLSRSELVDSVLASLPFHRGTEQLQDRIDSLLASLITKGLVRYRLDRIRPQQHPRLLLDESARRLAATTQEDSDAYSFTAWHETIALMPFDRYLLPLLDGTRGRAELIETMVGYAGRQAIGFQRAGRRVTDDTELREIIGAQIDQLPQRLVGINVTEVAEVSPDEWQSTSA